MQFLKVEDGWANFPRRAYVGVLKLGFDWTPV